MNARANRAEETTGSSPTIAVALGGGGARGLAHGVVLECLDEMGLRPTALAGTSFGAVIGAAYAAGMPARSIRRHIVATLSNRSQVMAKFMRARAGKFSDLLLRGRGNPVQIDPQICLEQFWPAEIPDRFEQLSIPLQVVATDFHACSELVFSSGSVAPAVAASIAIPGIFAPVELAGRVLIDGGAVNPLPYDLLFDRAKLVVAVDVTFGGAMRSRRTPTFLGAVSGAAQIMQGAITAQKIKRQAPGLLIRPPVDRFGLLDFLHAGQIMREAEAGKDAIKRAIAQRIEALQQTGSDLPP
jgi:NTE family protein